MRSTKRTSYSLIAVVVFLLVLVLGSSSAFATTFVRPINADSGSQITNTITLSKNTYPSGAPAVVVTNGTDLTQALSASVLAKAYGGPLLLTSSSSLTADVASELTRLAPSKVLLVGLPSSMASAVRAAVPALTGASQIVTLTGGDCYTTAALVAQEVKAKVGMVSRVVIVPGNSYASGVTVSALAAAKGWPIILTPSGGPFPSVSTNAITAIGATSAVIVGTNVTPSISGFTVTKRIIGATSTSDTDGRYDACYQLVAYARTQGWSTFSHVGLVGGTNYAGGMVLGAYLGRDYGTLLLTTTSSLHSTAYNALRYCGTEVNKIDFMSLGWPLFRQVKALNSPRVTGLSATSGPVGGGNSLTVTGTGLNTVTKVRIGKVDVATSRWRMDSSTGLTLTSVPAGYGAGPVEVLVTNYWNESPAGTRDLYWYAGGTARPADKVVQEAVKYLGVAYLWAGASPTYGFDCSGLVMYVYGKFGISLPHYSGYQATYGTAVNSQADLVPGDLVFFYSPISHVGMYVGGGLMINAPRSGDLVIIENAFRTSYVKARRLIAYNSGFTNYQQTDSRLSYNGTWNTTTTTAASGGSFGYANSSGSRTMIQFTGTGMNWVTKKSSVYGIAKVTLDGSAPVYVDLYNGDEIWQQKVWTTGTLSSGPHTVTIEWTGTKNAAATDTNIGIDMLEVAGTLTQAASVPGAVRYEQSDSRIVYTGAWTGYSNSSVSGGSCTFSKASGASATVHFTGTYLGWVGIKNTQYGIAKITVDGGTATYLDLYNATPVVNRSIWNTGTLPSGSHTVKIEWTGTKNTSSSDTYIGMDAFDVIGTVTAAPAPTRYQQSDSRLAYSGSWSSWSYSRASGGSYSFSKAGGSSVNVSFTGTYLSWIGVKASQYGIARVTVDGGSAQTVDLYSSTPVLNTSVWNTGTLPSGSHTVKIEWTGNKNTSSIDTYIGVDGFDVLGTLTQATAPVVEEEATVYQQSDPKIAYSGSWTTYSNSAVSGGTCAYSSSSNASITVDFTGTYLGWIGIKGPLYGVAKVTLDDGDPTNVDLYSPNPVLKSTVWETGTLASGSHTVKIEWTGNKNASAGGTYIGSDAFAVLGTLVDAHNASSSPLAGKVVVIDPGHQLKANTALEPVGPGSTVMKAKVSGGTSGVATGTPESQLVLALGLQLRDVLEAQGITVVMTRTTQNVDISNIERAKIANNAHADLFVRVHANGWTDSSYTGAMTLYPASITGWTDDISSQSKAAATVMQQELIKTTGAKDRGIVASSDMTGFNWSDVPVVIPEVGFMTNAAEDRLMATQVYRDKIVNGLANGIVKYLGAN